MQSDQASALPMANPATAQALRSPAQDKPLRLSDAELERMARSRARNLLNHLDRLAPAWANRVDLSAYNIVRVTRPTSKSMDRAEAALSRLPNCVSAKVLKADGYPTPWAATKFIARMPVRRDGSDGENFADNGVLAEAMQTTAETGSAYLGQVLLTEHFIVRLVQRAVGLRKATLPELITVALTLLDAACAASRLSPDGGVNEIPVCLTAGDGRVFIAHLALHKLTTGEGYDGRRSCVGRRSGRDRDQCISG